MTISDEKLSKAPFPWFGGKRKAAPAVWAALGDCPHYVEPFFGTGAVLLCRPHEANRPYYSETVNDADGLLVNFWRALQADPDAVADAASWPVSELDMHARKIEMLRWHTEQRREELGAQSGLYDAKIAGWWAWAVSSSISLSVQDEGPWVERDGRLHKRSRQEQADERAGLREPGITRGVPHLGNDGKGVNHAGLREPGIWRRVPFLTHCGKGVNRPQLREPGLGGPHPHTMPELLRWLKFLAARLRHVRIICGDWKRTVGTGAALTLPVRQGHGPCGVFLDPPYDKSERKKQGYAMDASGLSESVREWCEKTGCDPRWRIVLCGYGAEHDSLIAHGWRRQSWDARSGFLGGGYNKENSEKETLWLSPHCLSESAPEPEKKQKPRSKQQGFFEDDSPTVPTTRD